MNGMMVVPGAIGAFRREALVSVGGFATDTLAEDCDVTMRLLKEGYTVRSAPNALAYTEAPETAEMFFKQRFRWSFGILQSLWKHREAFLNPQYKALGMVALPQTLLFQFLLPLLAPAADVILLSGVLSGDVSKIGVYYAGFLAVELLAACVAYSFDDAQTLSPGKVWSMLWLFMLQRFVYRYMMYVPLVRSLLMVVRGTLVGWGVLKRTGTVVTVG
jgi:peptidoglycan-N-acetylglucosamine deacetylase